MEVGGLVHICDIDDDSGSFSEGGAAQVVEVDGGVRCLYSEAVLLDTFIVQGLQEGKAW